MYKSAKAAFLRFPSLVANQHARLYGFGVRKYGRKPFIIRKSRSMLILGVQLARERFEVLLEAFDRRCSLKG